MAQRYGGRHSPGGPGVGGKEPLRPAQLSQGSPGGFKVWLLFLPAIPLIFGSLDEGPVVLATALGGAAVLTLAAWMLREGLRAEAAYAARRVARRPALPRKMISSALTGIGIAVAAWTTDAGAVGSVLYGAVASALHVAAFGIDPLRGKNVEGIDTFQQDRVARAVDEAEGHLDAMAQTIARTRDRGLEARVARFRATAREMFRTIEDDPRDLTGARRYLGVYLQGARDATIKFVDLWSRNTDAGVKDDYLALLTDLETNFAARTERMLADDRTDMDIEIKVLRDRLQREGVTPPRQD